MAALVSDCVCPGYNSTDDQAPSGLNSREQGFLVFMAGLLLLFFLFVCYKVRKARRIARGGYGNLDLAAPAVEDHSSQVHVEMKDVDPSPTPVTSVVLRIPAFDSVWFQGVWSRLGQRNSWTWKNRLRMDHQLSTPQQLEHTLTENKFLCVASGCLDDVIKTYCFGQDGDSGTTCLIELQINLLTSHISAQLRGQPSQATAWRSALAGALASYMQSQQQQQEEDSKASIIPDA